MNNGRMNRRGVSGLHAVRRPTSGAVEYGSGAPTTRMWPLRAGLLASQLSTLVSHIARLLAADGYNEHDCVLLDGVHVCRVVSLRRRCCWQS